MPNQLSSTYQEAKNLLAESKYDDAINILVSIINDQDSSEESHKIKEKSIKKIGKTLVKNSEPQKLADFSRSLKGYLSTVSKAKMTKTIRMMIDMLFEIEGSDKILSDLCYEFIEMAKNDKNAILRQRLEFKLATAQYRSFNFQESLTLVTQLLTEVRKLDDKPLLVECYLLESKIHHGLFNLSKARASLTASKTNANEMYCVPSLQAELDTMSGKLHCDEKDYKTAYSYFYEAFENYDSVENPKKFESLKYMLLCKIMQNVPDEVHALINGKLALEYAKDVLEPMRAIAAAHANRSIKEFQETIHIHKESLSEDKLITRHLNELYEALVEQNLQRIIEPYSQVDISHIAHIIELPVNVVEKKLSQMILDKKLIGILDQESDSLIIFEDLEVGEMYTSSLATIEEIDNVVSSLYNRSLKLS